LSEASDGAGAGAETVFGVIIGTGCGGGVVVRGGVLTGPNAVAGEWGHNPPWPRDDERPGPPCYCGKHGCLETFVSGTGLALDYETHTAPVSQPQTSSRARPAATRPRGPRSTATWIASRAGLATVVNLLDPDVIAGRRHVERRDAYSEVLVRCPITSSRSVATRIVPPKHGDSSGVAAPPGCGGG
jgi:fructokinase